MRFSSDTHAAKQWVGFRGTSPLRQFVTHLSSARAIAVRPRPRLGSSAYCREWEHIVRESAENFFETRLRILG